MTSNKILIFLFTFFQSVAFAQNVYKIQFNPSQGAKVSHSLEKTVSGTILYEFPKTVPGTYATLDYGRFINEFKAFDASGKNLIVKKIANNTFQIEATSGLAKVEYNAQSIMHQKVKKDKIFEPASTFIDVNKAAVLNGGGIFGYIEGHENEACKLEFTKPTDWYGATSLQEVSNSATQQIFSAKNYHAVIDEPIIFAKPDTTSFYVKNTKVTLACYDVQGKKRSSEFAKDLEADLKAVGDFLPSLPVDRYNFLIFVDDMRDVGDIMNADKIGLFKLLKLQSRFEGKGLGALEHNTSSLYYLADFGENPLLEELDLMGQLNSSAIHEFMHIITPLNLHSDPIHNFNYKNPIMSQHLWLYEGVTEYFSHLIRLQGNRVTEEEFLKEMNSKIAIGNKFPKTMSFTEMSKNVLDKKYEPEYGQVYMRGAVLAWLLDINIRKVTQNKKTLIDVIWTFKEKYGMLKPFEETTFFEEFSKEVGPEILDFFKKYIDGKEEWPINETVKYIGLSYEKDSLNTPVYPFKNIPGKNELKFKKVNAIGIKNVVKKIEGPTFLPLQKGDIFNALEVQKAMLDRKMGETVNIPIIRNGQKMDLPYKLTTADPKPKTYLKIVQESQWKSFANNN